MEARSKDRISDLPDVILHHIFSFLPMTDVIRTSILAKRWQEVWISAPKLLFFEWTSEKRTLLLDVVERALTLRDSSLQEFGLGCDVLSESDASRISQVISGALRWKVQNLTLRFRNVLEQLELPLSFTCESLVSLTLDAACCVKLPSNSCFPSLKILELENVVFPDHYSTEEFFKGCPALEELTITDCSWENSQVVRIFSPTLWKLTIVNEKPQAAVDSDTDDEFDYIDYVNFSNSSAILISGSSLESFSIYSDLRDYYHIVHASSVAEASIQISRGLLCGDLAIRVMLLLENLSNVDSLQICDIALQALNFAEGLLDRLPELFNLTYLRFLRISVQFDSRAVQKILHNAPNLKVLEFAEGVHQDNIELISDPVPQCFSWHLQEIVISHFSGHQSAVAAVKMILKNVTALRMLAIASTLYDDDGYQGRRVRKSERKILSLRRASKDCEIKFVNGVISAGPWHFIEIARSTERIF